MRDVRFECGRIAAEISENCIARRPAELVHAIDARQDSDLALSVQAWGLAMQKWSDLENREFSYPKEAVMGFADGEEIEIGSRVAGTLRQGLRTDDVRARALSFGRIAGGCLPMRMSLEVAGAEALALEATLEIGGLTVRGDVAKIHPLAREAALALAARFSDMNEFTAEQEGPFHHPTSDVGSGGVHARAGFGQAPIAGSRKRGPPAAVDLRAHPLYRRLDELPGSHRHDWRGMCHCRGAATPGRMPPGSGHL